MELNELKISLKEHIIQELNLEDLKPEDIDDDGPLFGDGLGLDSIDALELVVIMDKFYGIKIRNEEIGKEILQSINTMANYILKEGKSAE